MNIIAVDDEKSSLSSLQSAIKEAMPDSALSCFNMSKAALEYAKTNRVDIAFLDIEMSGMNGLQLAKHLKVIYGKTIIIFVTGYSQYALDAFALHASGYLMKPVTVKAVFDEINYQYKTLCKCQLSSNISDIKDSRDIHSSHDDIKRVRVQTFGNFEVFVDGKPLIFGRSKTKELLAYLVSRKGALCNNNEVVAIIWEDKEDTSSLQSMFRALVADLTKTLKEADILDIIIKKRGYIGIMPENFSCDLYDFCAGINVNSYTGEFMNQYSWAEFTNMYLDRIQEKNKVC